MINSQCVESKTGFIFFGMDLVLLKSETGSVRFYLIKSTFSTFTGIFLAQKDSEEEENLSGSSSSSFFFSISWRDQFFAS